MALSSLVAKIQSVFGWNAQQDLTGGLYNPVTNVGTLNKSYSYGTSASNNTTTGGDEVFSFQQAIAAGATATIDMTAMTTVLAQANIAIVRVKSCQFRLLSATDDPTISPAPNSTSKMLLTNANTTAPAQLYFGNGGSGLTLNLTNSGGAINVAAINVAGSGYQPSATFLVGPTSSAGTGAAISATTNAAGIPTAVSILSGGSGYSNATNIGSVVLCHMLLGTGDANARIDVSANGTALNSTLSKNIKLMNLDTVNGVTAECDFFGATT